MLLGALQLPEDADERSGNEACRAVHDAQDEILHFVSVSSIKRVAGLFCDELDDGRMLRILVVHDGRHVDACEAVVLALFVKEFGKCHAEELAHVAAGHHLFEALLARLLRDLVELDVETARRQAVEATRFEVQDHRFLRFVRIRLEVAGVVARRVDAADVDVVMLVGGRELDGDRIVDDGRRLDIVEAFLVQRILEEIIDDLALDARRRKFLRPDDELRVVEVGLLRRERERMAEEILLRVIALHGLFHEVSDEAEHLLGRSISRDVVVLSGHDERLRDFLQDFEFAVAIEADAQHADIRAAEIEREVLARLLARRQADVRLQHAHGAEVGILEALLEVIAERPRDLAQLVAVDGEVVQNVFELLLVKCHNVSSPLDDESIGIFLSNRCYERMMEIACTSRPPLEGAVSEADWGSS